MNFRFYNDGTYKDNLNKKDASFYLIDISTDRKGSLYTITDKINTCIRNNDISVSLDISYAPMDVPYDDSTVITSIFEIDSIEKYYSIYPLIKQIFAFNTFCETWSLSIDSCISIANISINFDNNKISIDEYETDKSIKKAFSYLSMNTNVSDILSENEVIIMKKGKWWIETIYSNKYPKYEKFDYIIIPLIDTESAYLLTYKEYNLFRQDYTVQVNMLYTSDENSVIYSDDYCANWIDMKNLKDVLYSCLFTPQLILLEQKIYNVPMYLEIIVSTKYRDMKLSVSENEMNIPRNTCIFYIIKRLLELEP